MDRLCNNYFSVSKTLAVGWVCLFEESSLVVDVSDPKLQIAAKRTGFPWGIVKSSGGSCDIGIMMMDERTARVHQMPWAGTYLIAMGLCDSNEVFIERITKLLTDNGAIHISRNPT